MTREEAMQAIKMEGLDHFRLFENSYGANELGIQKLKNTWLVYATDERANVIMGSEAVFNSEGEAWDDFIERLRVSKELEKLSSGKYF